MKTNYLISIQSALTLAVLLALGLAQSAHAVTYTWSGNGTDGNWNNSANWDALPVPATTADLVFTGSNYLTTNSNNFTAASNFNDITFDSAAGAFTLAGNSITWAFSTAAGVITNNSSNVQTINLDLALPGSRTVNAASGNMTLGGVLSGAGGLTKNGAGTVTVTGNNSYNGTTTVSAGVLNIRNSNALGSTAGGTSVTAGAALQLQGGVSFAAESLTVAGNMSTPFLQNSSGDNIWNGTIGIGAGAAVRVSSDSGLLTLANTITLSSIASDQLVLQGAANILVSGKITGSAIVTSGSSGVGVRTLSNTTNDFSGGMNINGGTLRLGASEVIPNGAGKGNITITGTLDLKGFSETINGLSGAGTVDNVTTGTSNTLTIGDNNGGGTFSGAIKNTVGTLAVTKIGSGTVTLTGNNTYTGSTVVAAGTMVVSGNGTINSSSSVTVSTGATLTNNTAAALTPGLSLSEGSTLSGSGSFSPSALTVTADLAGGTFTTITLNSATFTKSGALAFTLTNVVDTSVGLFGGTTTPGGSFASVSVGGTPLVDQTGGIFSAEVGGFNYTYNDNFNSLAITAVPEPATWAMIGLGLTFVLYRKRFARLVSRR